MTRCSTTVSVLKVVTARSVICVKLEGMKLDLKAEKTWKIMKKIINIPDPDFHDFDIDRSYGLNPDSRNRVQILGFFIRMLLNKSTYFRIFLDVKMLGEAVVHLSSFFSMGIRSLKLETPNLTMLVGNLTHLRVLYLDSVNI
ncbi:hypothetical protein L2E82_47564 [Cichorium intybus]|uniref:Uncharacterized protein n=1 Tax=Cichorium intybus TaxID=13427 RepID=A0ACB8YVY4_CICIN|nr:hypothetical protein L2E82_47564 [Cichorium intybus]